MGKTHGRTTDSEKSTDNRYYEPICHNEYSIWNVKLHIPCLYTSNKKACHVGLRVRPVKGSVIIFYSLKPDGAMDELSIHGACPVLEGTKWAANKWVWNEPWSFYG